MFALLLVCVSACISIPTPRPINDGTPHTLPNFLQTPIAPHPPITSHAERDTSFLVIKPEASLPCTASSSCRALWSLIMQVRHAVVVIQALLFITWRMRLLPDEASRDTKTYNLGGWRYQVVLSRDGVVSVGCLRRLFFSWIFIVHLFFPWFSCRIFLFFCFWFSLFFLLIIFFLFYSISWFPCIFIPRLFSSIP